MALLRLPAYTEILLPFCALAGSIGALLLLGRKSELDRHAGVRHVGMAVFGAGPDRGFRHRRAGRGAYSPLVAASRGRNPNGCLPTVFGREVDGSQEPTAAGPGCARTVLTAPPS